MALNKNEVANYVKEVEGVGGVDRALAAERGGPDMDHR